MPPQTTVPPLRHRLQRRRHQLAGRREDQRGVELLGRRAERVAGPLRSQLEREGLGGAVVRAREGEHAAALVDGNLADDVGRRAEAVDAEPLGVAGHASACGSRSARRTGAARPGGRGSRPGAGSRSARPPRPARRSRRRGRSPVKLAPSQRFSRPERQKRQTPSVQPSQGTPTRSPGWKRSPPSTTRPTIWCPGTSGSLGRSSSPSTMCRSVRQTAQAATSRSTSPGPGSGSGRSASCSGDPAASRTIARTLPRLRPVRRAPPGEALRRQAQQRPLGTLLDVLRVLRGERVQRRTGRLDRHPPA